jgi:multidrug efflux pump subunit AcrA (membrane-fusion protein)
VVSLVPAYAQQAPTSAKIESVPLEFKMPDRYQLFAVLEPIRHVSLLAPVDGILRSFDQPVGAVVREQQEVGQLDRAEASARLKIARANVKEADAALKEASKSTGEATAKARLEAAQARAELAELDLDRCTLRAPFGGRLLEVAVFPGQFVAKGTKVAELVDVSSLRVLLPLERTVVSAGSTINLMVEGQPATGKVQSILPLPEQFNALRELAAVFTAAWVVIPNPRGQLDPGQRVFSPSLPSAPIAMVPTQAVRESDKGEHGGLRVQVIRNEYVTDIPVRALGSTGPERVQVSGVFRPNDALIVSSTVPLMAGTLIRFGGGDSGGGVEATSPNPTDSGEPAGITLPRGANAASPAPGRGTTSRGTSKGSSSPAKKKEGAPPF